MRLGGCPEDFRVSVVKRPDVTGAEHGTGDNEDQHGHCDDEESDSWCMANDPMFCVTETAVAIVGPIFPPKEEFRDNNSCQDASERDCTSFELTERSRIRHLREES